MAEVRPSAVRVRALEEHETLRRAIDELDAALAAPEPVPGEVLASGAKLLQELSAFIDLEEPSLLSAIRAADAWGQMRSQALAREHREHFAALGVLLSREQTEPLDSTLLVASLRAFVAALRETLDREKDEILGSDLLRDDVVGVDAD